jgi:methylmalonyl-CoA mutase
MSIGPSFYLEIAKFRAIRWLIGLLVRFFEPEFDEPLSVPIMADTTSNGYSSSAAQENLLRGTTRAIAAVAGGCDALIVRPYEVENDAPTGHARRMARNTQLILKHEAYLDRFTDPGSGSYYIEAITRQLVERVWDKFLASPDGPGPAPRVSTAV